MALFLKSRITRDTNKNVNTGLCYEQTFAVYLGCCWLAYSRRLRRAHAFAIPHIPARANPYRAPNRYACADRDAVSQPHPVADHAAHADRDSNNECELVA
ncbi:MAG: hypothetical protein GY803_09965 [Chloroflexi bacterium]|nr:hypothetical protein [Chloroflexota bacterium]